MGGKPRVKLHKVEMWARRCEYGQLSVFRDRGCRLDRDDLFILVNDSPNAAGVYPICQPGNTVPVKLVPDWKRYLK